MSDGRKVRVGDRLNPPVDVLIDDMMLFAHSWKKMVARETKQGARDLLESYGWVISNAEQMREFCDFFGKPGPTIVPHVGASMRQRILDRDDGICQACGSTESPEIDHKKPRSRGGTNHPNNLQVLCAPCNRSKGARTMTEWGGP